MKPSKYAVLLISTVLLSLSVGVQAKGWIKLDQVTKNVLSTENVAIMLMPNGTVWAADLNDHGLIDETAIFKPMATYQDKVLTGVVEVVAGEGHVLARRANGEVWAAGDNRFGQLGDGTTQTQVRFVPCIDSQQRPIVSAAAIVAGRDHSLILLESGLVLSAGANHNGQLGIGHYLNASLFSPALYSDRSLVAHIVGIEAKDDYSMLLRADETRWLAGRYPKLSIKPNGKVVTYKEFVEF
jgi:alpha-tubulin suppressor-like RCC1 family protein